MTFDEELTRLDDNVRRLKIDYEVFFNGGSQSPPTEAHGRVERVFKKYRDGQGLNFAQRFRFNTILQKYAVYNDLWRQKMRGREEGRGRFADFGPRAVSAADGNSVTCSDPAREPEKVDQLLKAMVEAKRKCGESVSKLDPMTFQKFVQKKTKQLQKKLGCKKVQYIVSIEGGKTKLKAVSGD